MSLGGRHCWETCLKSSLKPPHRIRWQARVRLASLTILPSGRRRCLALAALVCWLLALLAYQDMSSPNMTDGDAPNCAVGGIDSIASDGPSSALLWKACLVCNCFVHTLQRGQVRKGAVSGGHMPCLSATVRCRSEVGNKPRTTQNFMQLSSTQSMTWVTRPIEIKHQMPSLTSFLIHSAASSLLFSSVEGSALASCRSSISRSSHPGNMAWLPSLHCECGEDGLVPPPTPPQPLSFEPKEPYFLLVDHSGSAARRLLSGRFLRWWTLNSLSSRVLSSAVYQRSVAGLSENKAMVVWCLKIYVAIPGHVGLCSACPCLSAACTTSIRVPYELPVKLQRQLSPSSLGCLVVPSQRG